MRDDARASARARSSRRPTARPAPAARSRPVAWCVARKLSISARSAWSIAAAASTSCAVGGMPSITATSPNCRSPSTRTTGLADRCASATARLVARTLLPTPPLVENVDDDAAGLDRYRVPRLRCRDAGEQLADALDRLTQRGVVGVERDASRTPARSACWSSVEWRAPRRRARRPSPGADGRGVVPEPDPCRSRGRDRTRPRSVGSRRGPRPGTRSCPTRSLPSRPTESSAGSGTARRVRPPPLGIASARSCRLACSRSPSSSHHGSAVEAHCCNSAHFETLAARSSSTVDRCWSNRFQRLDDLRRRRELARVEARGVEGQVEAARARGPGRSARPAGASRRA